MTCHGVVSPEKPRSGTRHPSDFTLGCIPRKPEVRHPTPDTPTQVQALEAMLAGGAGGAPANGALPSRLQGYLAQKKQFSPLGLP